MAGVLCCGAALGSWHAVKVYRARQAAAAWEAQYKQALNAFGRAAEYSERESLLFEPRKLQFDTAFDALPKPSDEERRQKFSDLALCGSELFVFRELQDLDAQTLDRKVRIAKLTTKNQEQVIDVRATLDKVTKQQSAEREKLEGCSRTGRLP